MLFLPEIITVLVMIALNAVFAAYEMALASVSRGKLLFLVQGKKKGAAEALFMKDRMEASLAVVQLGITLVGAIAAATGGAGIAEVMNPYFIEQWKVSPDLAQVLSLIVLIIPLSALTIIFAELIPKTYAIRNSDWVVLYLSGFMKYFAMAAYPIVAALENIVKAAMRFLSRKIPGSNSPAGDATSTLHELTAAISLARTSRLINAQQEKIVMAAAQLSLRPVRDIMLPVEEICMIPLESSLSDALIQAHLDMHTRFPVCARSKDAQSIQGYVNFKDIIAALKINANQPNIQGILRPIRKFLESTPISKVLERMIQDKLHIALIENDQGVTTGMITQEDIIEELLGEIEDEFDRLPNHILPYGSQWLVGGAAMMSAVAKAAGIEWTGPEGDLKLADWCERHTDKLFTGGETITAQGLHITVRKLRRNKISEAFISKS